MSEATIETSESQEAEAPIDVRTPLQIKRDNLAALESEHATLTTTLENSLNGVAPIEGGMAAAMKLFERAQTLLSVDGKSGAIVTLREEVAREELDVPAVQLCADFESLLNQSGLAAIMRTGNAGGNFQVVATLSWTSEGEGEDVVETPKWSVKHSFPSRAFTRSAAATPRVASESGASTSPATNGEDKYVLVDGVRVDGVDFLKSHLANAIRDGRVNWGPRDATPDARAAVIYDNPTGRAHRIGQLARVLGLETNYA